MVATLNHLIKCHLEVFTDDCAFFWTLFDTDLADVSSQMVTDESENAPGKLSDIPAAVVLTGLDVCL